MPIHMNWAELDPPILHYTIVEPWAWEEFQTAIEESRHMIEACQFTHVDMVIDWSNARKIPNSTVSQMGNLFRRGEGRSRHIQGRFVVVGAPGFARLIFETLVKVYPKMSQRVLFTKSVDEAFAFLRRLESRPQ
ncbi:MAG: hypothetical protein HZC41_06785 [Chloroflexi bacterium]|nr:hypothetical protein [Chloroflexota bacterium]